MQQDLIKKIQQDMTILQANQAFNCSYEAVEGLCDCLSRTLQTALWLDNPDIINNQQYREEMLKAIREQAMDAFKQLPQYMGFLQEKKQSLTSTTKVLQEKIAATQADAQQIEQNFPKLEKVKQLEEQANLLLQQTATLLASKQQVGDTATATPSCVVTNNVPIASPLLFSSLVSGDNKLNPAPVSSSSNSSAAPSSKPEETTPLILSGMQKRYPTNVEEVHRIMKDVERVTTEQCTYKINLKVPNTIAGCTIGLVKARNALPDLGKAGRVLGSGCLTGLMKDAHESYKSKSICEQKAITDAAKALVDNSYIDVTSRDAAVKIIAAEIEKANTDNKKRKRLPSPPL